MVRTPVRIRLSGAADVHQARVVRRRTAPRRLDCLTAATLSAHIAAETSVFFTANVPPNPQHVSASGRSTRSSPRTAREQPQRRVADAEHPQRVARGVIGDPVREVRADVGDAEDIGEERRQVVHPGDQPSDVAGERRVSFGQHRVVLAHHGGAGRRRGDDRLIAGEGSREAAGHRHRLAPVAGVEVHLPAAGLARREVDLVPEPLEDRDHGLARYRGRGCRSGR